MKVEIRGTADDATKITIKLSNGAELDLTEQHGALRIVAELDSQDFCVRPAAANVVELSIRDR